MASAELSACLLMSCGWPLCKLICWCCHVLLGLVSNYLE